MVPYFGKNRIHYDTFQWYIYTTDHFEIYYYPSIEQHLERVAGYAESAYQQISADLKHDLSAKVPLIIFKTHSEFEQENIAGAATEGVGAFAEPFRQRIVLPIDDPPDRLYGLIVHELTHQFEFDIIPQGLIRRSVPLWVNEGLSDYERGQWEPLDLMAVRDAAVADVVPRMTQLEEYGGGGPSRLIYNLGHAVFEFIEAKFGKEGIRQFLFSLRKSVIGGGEDAYEEALRMTKDEFDQAFDRYLKDRFKPFRDKERPADYGRDLAPNAERTNFTAGAGDRAVAVGRPDCRGHRQPQGPGARHRPHLGEGRLDRAQPDARLRQGPRLRSHRADGRRLGGEPVDGVVAERRSPRLLRAHGEGARPGGAERDHQRDRRAYPDEDGGRARVAGLRARRPRDRLRRAAQRASATSSPSTSTPRRSTNITDDDFADKAPTYSLDGKFMVYAARVSGNEKLFRIDLDTKKKTQITFGTQDETAAQFIDDHTIVFASTATDPAVTLEPEVAKNGNIYNIWTLDLTSGELRQYTDAVSGNWSPIVLNDGKTNRIAFISYFKNDYSIRTLERKEPLHTAASADFGEPAPIIDFTAPLQHTLVKENQRKKGKFEKMFLEGRPPVNVGVTNSGDVFGGTQVSFGDVLGDKQVNLFAASISQYRTLSLVLRRPVAPLPVRAAGLLADAVLLRSARRPLLRPGVRAVPQPRRCDRDANGARRQRVRHLPVQPLPPPRVLGRPAAAERVVQRPRPGAGLERLPGGALRHHRVSQRHADAARRRVRAGDDRVP